MAGSRTLKLSILGDVDSLNKSLKAATADVDTFGDKMGKAGKAIGAAFAAAAVAAGAYAVKIGIDGVKAAIEDEKAQLQLAMALKSATGATEGQIKATEDAILQMSLATGVADDDLRPALQKLALSTNDLGKAQELLGLAMDISASTGKPLEQVSQALGLAFDGNTAALGKLKLGLTAAELKTMSFEQAQGKLSDLFGGAAAANAETYSGRIARMQVAFNEAKETIGFALLPILEKLMKYINQVAQPILEALNGGFSGTTGLGWYISSVAKTIQSIFIPVWNGLVSAFNSIKTAIGDNLESFKTFGAFISTYLAPVIGTVLGGAFQVVGKIAAGVINVIADVMDAIAPMINFAVAGINKVITGLNYIKPGKDVPYLPKMSEATTPKISTPSIPSTTIPNISLPTVSGASAGLASVSAGGSSSATAANNAGFVNQPGQASVYAADQARVDAVIAAVSARTPVTVNMGVVGDPEAAARAIVDVLNRSSGRGALGAEALIL